MKFLSAMLILTMMAGLCAAGAIAEMRNTASVLSTNLRKYGSDLAAKPILIGLSGLAVVKAREPSQRQALVRRTPIRTAESPEGLAAQISPSTDVKRALSTGGSGGIFGPMTISRKPISQEALSPRNPAVTVKKIGRSRPGNNQKMSVIRIRGHDGAASPIAPDDS